MMTWVELGRDPEDERRWRYDDAREALLSSNPPSLNADIATAVLDEIANGEHSDVENDGDAILELILAREQ